ncbi:hypothetical protein HRJ34_14730 [Rhizorhabdus wittichii]|uniref:Uncharacterized protein n=1 Tax=Rhizorhabdus wittichii TaxID=160791 RepID=A0A975D0V3_9SPHN|nr:hypothetical protein [Rhizorhabdus wittichii]QTH19630.1 hypothetical protein HRJ34_14730 [Rhizorhabdus wittichii]
MPDVTGMRVISPSKLGPWDGGYDEGERFSRPQLYRMGLMGIDPETVETVMVKVGVEEFLCPIVQRGHVLPRLKIIATGGERMWIDA